MFFAARSLQRRWVSVNSELPPSMIRSPGSSSGTSWSMTMSTGLPALTMIIALRGRLSAATNSSIVLVAVIRLPEARPSANFSVTLVVRLKTATEKPLLSMFKTRFSPMTARPIKPMSQVPEEVAIVSEKKVCDELPLLP